MALLKIEDVAARLRVSSALVYQLAQRGELPGSFKVGSAWRVDADQLEQAIRRRRGIGQAQAKRKPRKHATTQQA